MLRISNFDDWIDYFYGWQKEIGLDAPELRLERRGDEPLTQRAS